MKFQLGTMRDILLVLALAAGYGIGSYFESQKQEKYFNSKFVEVTIYSERVLVDQLISINNHTVDLEQLRQELARIIDVRMLLMFSLAGGISGPVRCENFNIVKARDWEQLISYKAANIGNGSVAEAVNARMKELQQCLNQSVGLTKQ